MKLMALLIADGLQSIQDGKINIFGAAVDTMLGDRFPAAVPRLAVYVRIQLAATECDVPHGLRLELLHPDGAILAALAPSQFLAQRRPEDAYRPVYHSLEATFTNIRFPSPGDYGVHVLVDNQELGNVPLYLRAAAGS